MPFFQRAFFTPAPAQVDQGFANLFQLINEIDSHQRDAASSCKQQQQRAQHHQRHSRANVFGVSRPFNPRFDVRETETTYELHGELAGVERNNVSIEFPEPQTLVVSGSVERNYSSQNAQEEAAAAAPAAEAAPEVAADVHSDDDETILRDGASTPVDDDEPFTEVVAPRSPSPSRNATVTDEDTEEALERGEEVTDEKAAAAAPAEAAAPAPAAEVAQPAAPAERYWFQERAVGQFKRVFNFPVPVDESSVRASLENGILSVSIPKAKREVRRIVVF